MNKRMKALTMAATGSLALLAGCGGGSNATSAPSTESGPQTSIAARSAPASPSEKTETSKPEPSYPPEVENAREAAKSYLEMSGFSKQGLIDQLSSKAGDGYPRKVAVKAVESLDVNYNKQAVRSAKSYLDMSSFSKSGLIQQLESDAGEQYTHAQAVYGVNHAYGK